MVTKGPYTEKVIFDYLQDIVLVCDEIIHEGYIVCLDAPKVFERIRMKDLGPNSPSKSTTKTEQAQKPTAQTQAQQGAVGGTFSSLFGVAKNTLNKTLNLG